jgi:hypothetical protein
MTSREHHFDHVAAGIASLDRRDPERVAADEHALGCDRCAEALRRAEQLMALIDASPPPALTEEALARLSRRVTRDTVGARGQAAAHGHAGAHGQAAAWAGLVTVLGASLALSLATGSARGLALVHGLHCAAIELVAAAVPYGVVVASVVRRRRQSSAAGLAATAAAGALAAQVYLLFRCADRMLLPHLLVTHTGAVLLAAVLGWIGSATVLRRVGAR